MTEPGVRARAWFALLRRMGRGVTGRRVTVPGATFTVAALHGRPRTTTASLRSARDARVVLHDVVTPELTARELVVEADAVELGSTVTAAGVTVTATVAPEALRALGGPGRPVPEVAVVDGELRSPWLPGVTVVIRPEVAVDRLRFVPVALITPAGRWTSPGWLPAATAPPPELPGGLRLVAIGTTHDAVVFRAVVDRWTAARDDAPPLRELLASVSRAVTGYGASRSVRAAGIGST